MSADALDPLVLARAMKALGVRSFKAAGIEVEFAPAEPSLPPTKAAKVDDELCRCGHHKHDEHVNGLCIMNGCDPTTCSPPEGK